MTFWDRCDKLIPPLCRIVARHPRGLPLLAQEIAVKGGNVLTPYQVTCISLLPDWESVPLGHIRAFLRGCGIDFCDRECMNRIMTYLKRRNRFRYLKNSPAWETEFKPIVAVLSSRG